jgi:hypothetical protein
MIPSLPPSLLLLLRLLNQQTRRGDVAIIGVEKKATIIWYLWFPYYNLPQKKDQAHAPEIQ